MRIAFLCRLGSKWLEVWEQPVHSTRSRRKTRFERVAEWRRIVGTQESQSILLQSVTFRYTSDVVFELKISPFSLFEEWSNELSIHGVFCRQGNCLRRRYESCIEDRVKVRWNSGSYCMVKSKILGNLFLEGIAGKSLNYGIEDVAVWKSKRNSGFQNRSCIALKQIKMFWDSVYWQRFGNWRLYFMRLYISAKSNSHCNKVNARFSCSILVQTIPPAWTYWHPIRHFSYSRR